MNELAKLTRVEAEEVMKDFIDRIGGVSPEELGELILQGIEADRAINNVKVGILTNTEFYTKQIQLLKMERLALILIKNNK